MAYVPAHYALEPQRHGHSVQRLAPILAWKELPRVKVVLH